MSRTPPPTLLIVRLVLFAFDDVVKELAALHVLHYQEQLLRSFNYFVELDDAGVADEFEDVDLAGDAFHVCNIYYFFLF